jgi:flagella basal body P-ring formation protein FlgA
LARTHGLDWRPASSAETVVIERDSVAITADEIGQHVLLELTRKGLVTEALTVEPLLGTRQLYRPRNAELAIDAVTTDPSGRRFQAILAIVATGQARQTLPIGGRLDRAVTVPVLKRALRPGEAIEAGDIAWNEVSERQLPTTAVRDSRGLVGYAARRALTPGSLVLTSDLRAAKLIAKGQPVTLVLQTPGMQLTAGGIAQEDGGEGDAIRIVNERSRTVVKGIVTGAGTVAVLAGTAIPAPRR